MDSQVKSGQKRTVEKKYLNLEQGKVTVRDILSSAKADSFDFSDALYKVIMEVQPSDRSSVLKYVCENFGEVSSNETINLVQSQYATRIDEYNNKYHALITALLNYYIELGTSEETFYNSLWNVIENQPQFDDEGIKIYTLYTILMDNRIPYFDISKNGLYAMSNSGYKSMHNRHVRDIQKIRFILNMTFDQRTEMASALLREFEIMPPENELDNEGTLRYEKCVVQMIEIVSYVTREKIEDIVRMWND